MVKTKPAKRSPIKQLPLPQAGEGLKDERVRRVFDLLYYMFVPLMILIFALMEWLRYWMKTPPAPYFTTVLAVAAAGYSWTRGRRVWQRIRNLELGEEGERSVGSALEGVRDKGYHVFHDLSGSDFNVDHVLVGPAGVFAIETKTISKPNDHDAKVLYDGNRILVDGRELDRDPLVQAKAAARHVREVLRRQTGQEVAVQPVVVFPGWFVEVVTKNPDVYVCNDKFLVKSFDFEHRQRRLDERDVKLLVAGMEREQRQ